MKGIRTWTLQDFSHVLQNKSHQASVPNRRFWSFFEFSRKENASQESTEIPASKDVVPSGLVSANRIENSSGIRAPEADGATRAVMITPKSLSSTFLFEPKGVSKTTSKAQRFFFERNDLMSLLDGNPVPRNLKLKLKGYKTLRHENAGDFAFVPGGASCEFDIVPRGNYDGWTRTTTFIADVEKEASNRLTSEKSFDAKRLAILPSHKPKISDDISSWNPSSLVAESHQATSNYSPTSTVENNTQKIVAHPDKLTWKPVKDEEESKRTAETSSLKPETQPETQFNRYFQDSSQPVKYESKSGPSPTTSFQEMRPHFRPEQESKLEKTTDKLENIDYHSLSNIPDNKLLTISRNSDSPSCNKNPLYVVSKGTCSSSKGLSKPSPPSASDCSAKCGSTTLTKSEEDSVKSCQVQETFEKQSAILENSPAESACHVADEWSSMEHTVLETKPLCQPQTLNKVTSLEPPIAHNLENNRMTQEDLSTTYFAPLPPRTSTRRPIGPPRPPLIGQRDTPDEVAVSKQAASKKLKNNETETREAPSTYFAPLPPSRLTRRSIDSLRSAPIAQGEEINKSVGSEQPTAYNFKKNRVETREGPSTTYFAPLPPKRSAHPSLNRLRSISHDRIPRSRTSPIENHQDRISSGKLPSLLHGQPRENPPSCAANSARSVRNEDHGSIPSSIDPFSCSGNSGNNGSKKPPGSLPPIVPRRASSSKCSNAFPRSPRKIPRKNTLHPETRNSVSNISTGASIGRKCRGDEGGTEGKVICTKPREDKCRRPAERTCKRERTSCDRGNRCQQRSSQAKCQRESSQPKCKRESRQNKCQEDGRRKAKQSKPCKRYCCPELTNTMDCAFEREQCPKKSKKRCRPDENERRDRPCNRGRERSCSRGGDRSCSRGRDRSCSRGEDTSRRKRDPTCLPDPKEEASCGRRQERECEGQGRKFCTDPSRSRRDCGSERRDRSCKRESSSRNKCRENSQRRGKNRSCEREDRECSRDDRASGRQFCTKPKRESCMRERSCETQCRRSASDSGRRCYSQLAKSMTQPDFCDNAAFFSSSCNPTCSALCPKNLIGILEKRAQPSILKLQSQARYEGEPGTRGYSSCDKNHFFGKKDSKPGPSCKSSKDSCPKTPKCKPPDEKPEKKKCTKGPANCLPKRPSACEKISKESKCDKESTEKKKCGSTPEKCKKTSADTCAKRKEICMKDKGKGQEESIKDRADREHKEMQECKKSLKDASKGKKADQDKKETKGEKTGLERVVSPCKKDQEKKKDDGGKKCESKCSSQKFSDTSCLSLPFNCSSSNLNDVFSSKPQETSPPELKEFDGINYEPRTIAGYKSDPTNSPLNEGNVKVNYTKNPGYAALVDRIQELWKGGESTSFEAVPLLVDSENDEKEDTDENPTSRNAWILPWFG